MVSLCYRREKKNLEESFFVLKKWLIEVEKCNGKIGVGCNNHLYNGKEKVGEGIGLDWLDYGARYYDSIVGRWMSVDPLTETYSFQSGYAYAANNPVLNRDIMGLGVENKDNEYNKWLDKDGDWQEEKISDLGGDEFDIINYGRKNADGNFVVDNVAAEEVQKSTIFTMDEVSRTMRFSGKKITTVAMGPRAIQPSYPEQFFIPLPKLGLFSKLTSRFLMIADDFAISATVEGATNTAAKTSSRAFFSGGGAEARAIKQGFSTLSQTRAGQNLMQMTKGMPYYPGSQAYNWWARLSSTYAKGIPKGSNVYVFLNNPSLTGIWNAVEKPILQQRGINIIYK